MYPNDKQTDVSNPLENYVLHCAGGNKRHVWCAAFRTFVLERNDLIASDAKVATTCGVDYACMWKENGGTCALEHL